MSAPEKDESRLQEEAKIPTSDSSTKSEIKTVRKAFSHYQKRGADDSILRPENVWQRLQRLPKPRQASHQYLPISSTPRESPEKVTGASESLAVIGRIDNVEDDAYTFTPVQESLRAQLGSTPQPLLDISGDMTNNSLQEAVNLLDIHVSSLARIYGDVPDNIKEANTSYKKICAYLNRIRIIAAGRSLDDIQLKCNDLASQMESYKMKWQIHSINTSKSTGSFFHGHTSIDFNRAASNLPTATNHARVIKDLDVRMKALENVTSTVNQINAKIPQLEEQINCAYSLDPIIIQRITNLEANYDKHYNKSSIDALSTRVSTLESSIAQLIESSNIQSASCIKSAECQRSLVKDYASFQDSTRNDIDYLTQILDRITTRFESCIKEDLCTQPEVSSVQKHSCALDKDASKVNIWLLNQHSDKLASNELNPAKDLQHSETHENREENSDDETKSDASSRSSSTLDIYSRSLKRQMKALGKLLLPEPSNSLDKATLNDMYNNRLPLIDLERRDLQRSLREYLKMSNANIALCDDVEDSLDSADLWSSNMREIYLSNGHHKKSQTKTLYDTLPKFSHQSEIDIFEFTRRFEHITNDFEIPEEKAEIFYSRYLTSSLQDEVVKVKENYDKMKDLLLLRYGDLETITNNIILVVSKEKLPSNDSDLGIKLTYYRKLQSTFQKIDKLVRIPDVSIKEVEDFIFGHQFLKQLSQLLPEPVLESFVDAMRNLGQNITKIRGKIAFKTMLTCTNQIYEKIDSMARNTDFFFVDKSKNTKEKHTKGSSVKQANFTYVTDESSSSDYDTDTKLDKGVYFQNKELYANKREKHVSHKKFPCIFKDHKHGLSECVDFFSLSPIERVERKKEIPFKYCTFCLQSNNDCKFKQCSNAKFVPAVLKCKDCVTNVENNNQKLKAAYSIFFCINDRHVKPSNIDILKGLNDYVPGFSNNLLKAPVNLA